MRVVCAYTTTSYMYMDVYVGVMDIIYTTIKQANIFIAKCT